jgi:DNA gyrase subunit A
LIFTSKGRVYWLKVYTIPDSSTTGKGKHTSNLVNLQPDETVTAFLPVKEFVAGRYIVMVTKHGIIKKSELTEFDNPLARGINAIGLDEGDELLAARLSNGEQYVFLASHEGMATRFKETQVRPMGRGAHGVNAMDLEEGDYLVGAEVVDKTGLMLSYSEGGIGKRTPIEDYRLTSRGKKGVINMKITPRSGKVLGILSVKEESELMLITQQGQILRIDSGTIRQTGRSASGVKLVTLDEGDQVAAVTLIPDSVVTEPQEDLPLQ